MKYVCIGQSPNMFNMPKWGMDCHELTQNEFTALAKDAYSCINHKGLAHVLGLKFNPGHANLRPGDVLLSIHLKGGFFPPEAMEKPDDVILEFYCYQITESSSEFRGEKVLMEE